MKRVTLRPVGRGKWRRQAVSIATPDLLLQVRHTEVCVGERWFLAGRWWRVVEVLP